MKKLMTLVAAVALATAANAMAVQWQYYDDSAGGDFEGARVYMLLSAPADSYASEAAIGGVGYAEISAGSALGSSKDDSIVKDDFTAYFVIATDEGFYTSSAYTIEGSYVYNPGDKENPESTFEAGTGDGISGFKAWGGPGPDPTPEPTSGLLLLLGVAGLALRRKQK